MNNIVQKLIIGAAAMLVALFTRAQELPSKQKDVGEIPIQYTLTPTGAVTYQVPIDIHPDPEQFQPQLSFSYNSQQSESAMGYGWNIGGLSGITHVAGTIYYDGKASPLALNEDRLMLDGMRLIKIGTDTWQTEQGFVKVKKQTEGTLEVRYPNGNIATFETSANAPFNYVLTNYRNMKGNVIKYFYTQADNLPYIKKIIYGESGGVYNDSIIFDYQNLTDVITRYAAGKAVRYSRLLNGVESYHRGQLWRRYLLTYLKHEINQLVRLDCETKNRALNPLSFEYGDQRNIEYFQSRTIQLGQYFANSVLGNYDCLVLSRGRFKATSASDGLISYPQKSTYSVVTTRNLDGVVSYKFDSNYATNQELAIYKKLYGIDMDAYPAMLKAGYGFQKLTAVDVDGTGVDALVKVNYRLKGVDENIIVTIYNDIDNLSSYNEYEHDIVGRVHDGAFLSPRQREFLFGDFNGDGKTEMLAISSCRNHFERHRKIASNALLVDLQNRVTLFAGDCFDYAYFQASASDKASDRLIAMDYNGDGKTDICLINLDGTYVYEFTGSGFKQLAYINSSNGGIKSSHFNSGDRELMVADMNGDGNMDLILSPCYSRFGEMYKHVGKGICYGVCHDEQNLVGTSAAGYKMYYDPVSKKECDIDPNVTQEIVAEDNGKTWQFILSTGNSGYSSSSPGFTSYSADLFHGFHETAGQNFMLLDVDSDGLPDLIGNVRGKIDLYLNNNGRISSTPDPHATLKLGNLKAQFAMANIATPYYWAGGLICVNNSRIHIYDYTRKEKKERMIRNVTNSCGVTTNHTYVDIMSTVKARYEASNGNFGLKCLTYPYTVMSPHCYVNVWAKKQKGSDVLSWEYYKYRNAVFHQTGLGFRGFQQIETEDVINSRKMVSTFDPTMLGVEVKRETPTDTIDRQYILDINPNKISLLKLQKQIGKNVLSQAEERAEYQYNSYGQMTHSKVSKESLNIVETFTEYLNVDNENTYLLGLQTSSVVEKKRSDSLIVQLAEVEYNERYMPVRKKNFVNGNIILEERFTYDENLRLTKHEQRPYNSADWIAKSYAYDAMGRLARETDAMGVYTDYWYSAQTGLMQSVTDGRGRAIQNEYDEWGNQLVIRYPDGRVKQTIARWADKAEPGRFVATTTETGKPTFQKYYDFMGREIRSSQIRFDGKEMKIDKVYNTKTGVLERVSQPTTDEQPSQWNQYSYDVFDRLTSTRYASGKIDSCAYGILTDTIIENGIRHIRKYDEAGMMTKATDAAGSIDYYYRPDGQPMIVVAPGSVQTCFYYDKYGRRTAIKDPSAGIRRTDYDPAGNVCKETDADGKEITKKYDRYGRIISQTTPDIHTAYTYDDTENLLLSAVSDNGTALRYTYDAYRRMKIQREEAPKGKWLQKEYSYTTDGLPASISYSSQEGALTTELLTYVNGYLAEVRLADGTLVYRHDEENALGQLTKLSTGEMKRNYEFNEWGLPARRTITRADESIVFDHSYAFNVENNNLESRTDETRGLTETFGYDFLNRLSIYGSQQVAYDDSGNILSKDDAGTLVYTNPNRPYAVTGFDPVAGKQAITGLNITYTAAQRPSVLTQGTKRVVLMYNANHDRTRMQVFDENTEVLTRCYLGGNYEQDIDSAGIQERLYLGGSYYDAPSVLVKQNGQSQVYYIHRDYLGSILQIVDVHGNVVEENSFDAWGCRRNPATQTVYANGTAPKLMLGRGYTGHEHLAAFGLINMNARLYDPILGRFLSPDPYVQSPGFTQAFNRYSYCMNSPLCYVDENGEFWWLIAAAVIGGAINVATHWGSIDNFAQGLGYFGIGAAAGAVGAITGGAAAGVLGGLGGVAGGAITGMASGAASGFILGGGNTLMAGGNFGDAMLGATSGMLSGAIAGSVTGGVFGGASSYVKGENVWNGSSIAPGRNAFSLKNTPITETRYHRPIGSNPSPQPSTSTLPQGEIRNYSVTTYERGYANPMMEGKELINRPLQIKGYDARLVSQNDLYHNFPHSFDEDILKGGWVYGVSGNSTMMVAPGTVNGINGIYTLGLNSTTGIIYHRAFYEWGNFMKTFKF